MSVGSNIAGIFDRKIATLYAYAKTLAQECVKEGQDRQLGNEFWNNQTFQAVETLFGDAFMEDDAVGFFFAHKKDYGVYLTLANDRQNDILLPLIEKYALKFKLFAEELFGATGVSA